MMLKTFLKSPIPLFPLLSFFGFWFFTGILYKDMFYMAEQHSLFVFDRQVMQFILNQPFGEALCIGRFLLLSFHEPILGGMLLSLILTATVCLLKYISSLQGKWEWLSLLLSILVIMPDTFKKIIYQAQAESVTYH